MGKSLLVLGAFIRHKPEMKELSYAQAQAFLPVAEPVISLCHAGFLPLHCYLHVLLYLLRYLLFVLTEPTHRHHGQSEAYGRSSLYQLLPATLPHDSQPYTTLTIRYLCLHKNAEHTCGDREAIPRHLKHFSKH